MIEIPKKKINPEKINPYSLLSPYQQRKDFVNALFIYVSIVLL